VTACEIGADVILGPFAHLRDGAVIEREARIGNFVEVKKSRVGEGTKASHLTYLGDATLGQQVNIGAGTVTCNYDGEKKNPTRIGNGVFIGSGSMLVAPVQIAEGSYVAAGSTITEDVPPESLAVGRAHQVNKEGWARKHKDRVAESGPEDNARKSREGLDQ
jgi:bifunctional UDP-N-acetylglucosamine pyrophosphorylase / glucosamine-1-phosphate N-acetyltransferase